MFYVYVHKRLSDNKVFYVGKGAKRRINSHGNRNKHWRHVVEKHGFLAVISKSFEDEQEAFEYEKELIEHYRKQNAPLTNIESGGLGGTKGRDMTACIEAAKKHNTGRPVIHSEETKKKISESHKGKKLSIEHKEKMRLASTGRATKQSTRDKLKKAYADRKARGYKHKAWNKGKTDIYTVEQRERISAKVKEHALTRLQEKGYRGGVGFHKASGKWRAYVVESRLGHKVQVSKGLHASKEDAESFLRALRYCWDNAT